MTHGMELEVPTRHGEVVCVPEFGRWLELARETARRLEGAQLHGRPLAELREQARTEIAARAQAMLRRWGLDVPEVGSGPWVATGHQPTLYHPGIWIKTWALSACAESGAVGLHVVVDSDECQQWGARVPRRNGTLRAVERTLVACAPAVPFESAPVPEEAAWSAFCAQLRDDLATVGVPELVERVSPLEEAGRRSLGLARHLGEFGAAVRRRLEARHGPVRYLEVTVSELAQSRAFARFAAWLAEDAERFWAVHNAALDDHRGAYGVRNPAQPFPNLRREGRRVELPFWVVEDGRRHPAFVEPADPPVVFCHGRAVGELADRVPDGLRPRALALTLFLRLVVCDLFVHGLGGAHYDRVTDRVLQEFFGVAPPPFAVLTATFHLPLVRHPDPHQAYAAAHRLWWDLQHNPDRHLPDQGEVRALVEEKWHCIRALQAPELPRAARRELTRRIRAVNEALRARLQERIREVEAELASLRREVEEHEVAADRGYPFFLFDPAEVRARVPVGEEARCR